MFCFAQPNQIIRAVKTYCCSMHNCMTWPLYSTAARQFYNCWSTCVKLAWDVDRATKSYLVENLLSGGLPSMRSSILACYGRFYHGVRHSPALEIRTLACIATADFRSTTGTNLIQDKAWLNVSKPFLIAGFLYQNWTDVGFHAWLSIWVTDTLLNLKTKTLVK